MRTPAGGAPDARSRGRLGARRSSPRVHCAEAVLGELLGGSAASRPSSQPRCGPTACNGIPPDTRDSMRLLRRNRVLDPVRSHNLVWQTLAACVDEQAGASRYSRPTLPRGLLAAPSRRCAPKRSTSVHQLRARRQRREQRILPLAAERGVAVLMIVMAVAACCGAAADGRCRAGPRTSARDQLGPRVLLQFVLATGRKLCDPGYRQPSPHGRQRRRRQHFTIPGHDFWRPPRRLDRRQPRSLVAVRAAVVEHGLRLDDAAQAG